MCVVVMVVAALRLCGPSSPGCAVSTKWVVRSLSTAAAAAPAAGSDEPSYCTTVTAGNAAASLPPERRGSPRVRGLDSSWPNVFGTSAQCQAGWAHRLAEPMERVVPETRQPSASSALATSSPL